jgi:hypothetical protein
VDDDTAATVSEVWQTNQGIRFKFHDKLQALEKLGRHLVQGRRRECLDRAHHDHRGMMPGAHDPSCAGMSAAP